LGSYCPTQASTPTPCPAGTYGNGTGSINAATGCVPCTAGFYCLAGSAYPTAQCPRGFYCPTSTPTASSYPCTAGNYVNSLGSIAISACSPCPSTFYCPQGTGDYSPNICPPGYYCPQGTTSSTLYPCPAGLYSGQVGLNSSSQCQSCPAGSYCVAGTSNPTNCPPGTYNPSPGSGSNIACLACPAGYACPNYGMFSYQNFSCIEGHFCPLQTSNNMANSCPAGTYTNSRYLTRSYDCEICFEGFACYAGTGGNQLQAVPCAQGHYCPGVPFPGSALNFTRYYYGTYAGQFTTTPTQFPCPAGKYTNSTSLTASSECTICPPGSYCTIGSSAVTGACAQGYYCPAGSGLATQYACPAGFYSTATNIFNASQCLSCPMGQYCLQATITPTTCNEGTYSPRVETKLYGPSATDNFASSAQYSCITCPAGYRCSSASGSQSYITPEQCNIGYYSPSGSNHCYTCQVGYYCPSNTTSQSAMLTQYPCPAGLYCPAGMDVVPTVLSNSCPAGQYCPQATTLPIDCPVGTYNPVTGGGYLINCTTCPAGSYCTQKSIVITGQCSPGYYCPAGSTGPTQVPCDPGTYRSISGGMNASSCAACETGYYCISGTSTPSICPRGSYCLVNTVTPIPCPRGTYGNSTGLKQVTDCNDCDAGTYCDSPGQTQPTGPCDPGFYCTGKSITSAPLGGLCPAGGYCPTGSRIPTACAAGTFNNVTGGTSQSSCQSCPPGYYCSGTNNPSPSGQCSAGYYCTGGSYTPIQFQAIPGMYSVAGSSAGIPCPPGTYNNQYAQSICLPCPQGYFCSNQSMTTFDVCPAGYYCPAGTAQPLQCPRGSFSSAVTLYSVSQCATCTPGHYCDQPGLQQPAGDCAAGYYCSGGSWTSAPVAQSFGDSCTAGHYCTNGTSVPIGCPAGTYSSSVGNRAVTDCIPCTPGYYCNSTGLTTPAGKCSAGYYCSSGASTSTPSDGITGDICQQGYNCPLGSSAQQYCSPGYYQNQVGGGLCLACPIGYICDGTS
jgi:hypothetical protein